MQKGACNGRGIVDRVGAALTSLWGAGLVEHFSHKGGHKMYGAACAHKGGHKMYGAACAAHASGVVS